MLHAIFDLLKVLFLFHAIFDLLKVLFSTVKCLAHTDVGPTRHEKLGINVSI